MPGFRQKFSAGQKCYACVLRPTRAQGDLGKPSSLKRQGPLALCFLKVSTEISSCGCASSNSDKTWEQAPSYQLQCVWLRKDTVVSEYLRGDFKWGGRRRGT